MEEEGEDKERCLVVQKYVNDKVDHTKEEESGDKPPVVTSACGLCSIFVAAVVGVDEGVEDVVATREEAGDFLEEGEGIAHQDGDW